MSGTEKLFIFPVDGNKTVFSTRSAHNSALNLKKTTDIMRERLCYAFLVAQDPALSKEQREDVQEAFVNYLAEISRANNRDIQEEDNPSCFPGSVSRLDCIFQTHPQFHVKKELFEVTRELANQLIIRAFSAELECGSVDRAKSLYEAIVLFSNRNAIELLNHPEEILTTEGEYADLKQLLSCRAAFFKKYFGADGKKGIEAINAQLLKEGLFLDEDKADVALYALMNPTSAVDSLTEAYQRYSLAAEKVREQQQEAVAPVVLHQFRSLAVTQKTEKEARDRAASLTPGAAEEAATVFRPCKRG